jgi:hypothetical protein
MVINPTPGLLEHLYWITLLAVVVSWGESLLFIRLITLDTGITFTAILSGFIIFSLRLVEIYYDITLPRFRFK